MRLAILYLTLLLALPGGLAQASTSLVKVPTAALSDNQREILAQAFRSADQRHWQEALRLARQAGDPVAAKIITWRRLNKGGDGIAFRDYAAFIDRNPDWPRLETLQANAEKAMDDALGDAAVVAWFTRHPPVTPEGRVRFVDALLGRGLVAKAGEWVRYIWHTDVLEHDEWRKFYNRYRRFLRADDHWVRVDNLLWDEQYAQARRMLPLLPRRERDLVAARLALHAGSRKVNAYLARVDPALRKDPGLIYERVLWRQRYGKDADVAKLLLAVPGDLGPKPEKWWAVRGRLARDMLQDGEISTAYRLAAGHGQPPGTPEFAEAEWFAGWLALRFLDDKPLAARHFFAMFNGVKYPLSRSRGAYWRARASAEMGQASHAVRWYRIAARYPTTYYGQLASEALNARRYLYIQAPATPSGTQWRAFLGGEVARAAVLLGELKQWITFHVFVVHLAETASQPIEHTMLAGLATHYGRYDLAVRASKISVRSGQHVAEYGYPLFRLPQIRAEPALVFAIMRQESEFSRNAVSSAGASGLMQLMPATAREISRSIGLRYSRGRLLTDPNYNVRLGSAYVVDMLREFDGSYLLAVAAYNAGPGRVREWIREFGDPRADDVDPVDWVESIPSDETRNYVQRVLEGLQVYRHRLAERPIASRLTADLTSYGRTANGGAGASP